MSVIISANTAALSTGLSKASSQFANFDKQIGAIGRNLVASFGIYQLASGVSKAVGIMADFEHTMSEVMAITGATGREFEDLRNDALRLGASTKYTATQVGQLQIAYGRLGFTTKEILAATEATLDLAAATGEDLAKSADVAGSTVRGFGLQAKETQRVVDVMASSFNKSALSLENFSEAMKFVAPVANAAGASVEETTALLATLADAGIRGSIAGTSLRKIFTDIAKDGRPLGERLKELGEKGITMSDAFDEVGRTAQTSLLILAKNTEKTDELARAFENASGEAAKMARIMQDNLTGDITKLNSAFEGLILSLGKSSVIRDFIQKATTLVTLLKTGGNDIDKIWKEIAFTLTKSGDLSKFSNDDIQANLERYTVQLAKLRTEAGKPFDAIPLVESLAEQYNLTSEAAAHLYQVILKANEALSFQEKVIQKIKDTNVSKGYNDLNKAAEDYKNQIYKLIVAQQIEKDQNEKFATLNPELFAADTKRINEKIASYWRIIRLINDYQKDAAKAEEKVKEAQKPVIKNLEFYREKLKEVNEEYDKTAILTDDLSKTDAEAATSRLRVLAQEIQGLQDKIKLLEMIRKHAGDDFSLMPSPNKSKVNITTGIDDALMKRLAEQMEALRLKTKNVATEIKDTYIDMSSSIGDALTGIADAMGSALAGTGNFGQDMLKVLAKFAGQIGQALIAIGAGMLKARMALSHPATAIAAGVALVALSAALGASLSKAQSNFNNGGGGVSAQAQRNVSRNPLSTDGAQLLLGGEFRVKGTDLVLVLSNQNVKSQRTG